MQDLDIQASLTRPADGRGEALLALPESQWLERKSARVSGQGLAATLAAFANAEGGTVVIGLGDGRVEGINGAGVAQVNEWRQAGLDHCEPPVKVTWQEVECRRPDGRPDRLLVGEVLPSPLVHASKADDVYLRVGDENRKLSFAQRQELIYDKGQAQFDGTVVPGAVYGDLDADLTAEYADAIGSPDPPRALLARGLLKPDGAVTVGGWLLFAPQPQALHPSAYLRVIRYEGLTKETGVRQSITADERCEGPVPRMLDLVQETVGRLQPKRRVLGSSGRFVLQELIPRDAWLEGVVNAVVHRSYSLGGDHIRVEIFDDRIEITSPGGFPGLSHPSKLPTVTRFARNPRIARACADLRYGQELGEGIRRMFEEMRTRGLADPLYSVGSSSVRLVLTSLVADGRVLGQFSAEYLQVMDVLRRGQRLSTGDVAEALGISRPTAKTRLRHLQDAGYLDWVGKSPQDPRAYWRLRSE